jgi:predicted lipid-binding transport protein (Tim44 family)
MSGGGGFPIDLILFGMIAVFLVLRLRSVLGKRTGYERPPQQYQRPDATAASAAVPGLTPRGPVIDGRAEAARPAEPATSAKIPDPSGAAGQALGRMRAIDPSFDPSRFVAGAEQAFRLIVSAFAEGRRDALRPLLGDEMYAAFDGAVTAREQAKQTQQTEIRGIQSVSIDQASLLDHIATITVRFVSDQVSMTTADGGAIVAGSDAVTEITDLWTFERSLGSADPTWRLIAARSA